MICKECGEKNPEIATFCKNCGAKLKEEDVKKTTIIEENTYTNQNETIQGTYTNQSGTTTTTNESFGLTDCCLCILGIFVIFAIIAIL
ncbi:MAG: zinc-ribbon domain-containing protein [Methanobrevibacter sp.]|uniref:zinc-ribbon domain-containing protein n=1 Tax=Methanobrevibacter sp. TaxID=66852 RepID=UPI003F078BCC